MTPAPTYILHAVTVITTDGACHTYRVIVRADPRRPGRADPVDRRRAVAGLLVRVRSGWSDADESPAVHG